MRLLPDHADPARPDPGPVSSPWEGVSAATIDRLTRSLQRYLRVIGCRPDRIEDLAQEAFTVAVQSDFAWQGPRPAAAFLRRTAHNLFLAELRSNAARREVTLADQVWQRECGDDEGDGYVAALRDCMASLSDRQRRLLEGSYRDALGRRELALALGMKPDGIKTALRRVRAFLKNCVDRKRKAR